MKKFLFSYKIYKHEAFVDDGTHTRHQILFYHRKISMMKISDSESKMDHNKLEETRKDEDMMIRHFNRQKPS